MTTIVRVSADTQEDADAVTEQMIEAAQIAETKQDDEGWYTEIEVADPDEGEEVIELYLAPNFLDGVSRVEERA